MSHWPRCSMLHLKMLSWNLWLHSGLMHFAKRVFLGRQLKADAGPLAPGPVFHLEAEIKKHADLIANLQSAALANSRAHNELVQHFQQLRGQVRLNSRSQQLLQDLSGVTSPGITSLAFQKLSHNFGHITSITSGFARASHTGSQSHLLWCEQAFQLPERS